MTTEHITALVTGANRGLGRRFAEQLLERGATVDAANRLVTSGTTADPSRSWAAQPGTEALVGLPSNATYVSKGCVSGEPTGDQRLAELSAPGDVVARFGGDEFVLLRPGADEPTMVALARRVASTVLAPFGGMPDQPVGVSVGVAVGHAGETADEVIARADLAMYGAKSHHRRRQPRD